MAGRGEKDMGKETRGKRALTEDTGPGLLGPTARRNKGAWKTAMRDRKNGNAHVIAHEATNH